MSVNVRIRTKSKKLDFEKVLKQIAGEGYELVVKFMNPEICEFYQYRLSTRSIDLSLENNGYDVRITSLTCKEDYELFAKTIAIVQEQIKGNVFLEDNDDEPVGDVKTYFGSEWIERQMEGDASVINTLVLGERNDPESNEMHEVGLFGPICTFYVGKNLLEELGITIKTDWHEVSEKLIKRFRYSQYSRPRDIRRTTTSMAINLKNEPDNGGEREGNKLTVYGQNAYDMISRTNYVAIMGNEENMLLLKYKDFMKVVPEQWERFDNCQYFTSPLTDKQFKEFWDRAREYCIDKPAPNLKYDEKNDKMQDMGMAKAWFFTDVDYVRGRIKEQGLPPCAKADPCEDGVPPTFYAIVKCQEIIFGSDDYAPEYMPVVLEMRKRTKAMLDYWEKEIGIPEWRSIPFREFSDMFYVPDDDDTISDVMGFEPKDFRDAGFDNSDLLLYMAAQKFDFKRVLNSLRAGCDPDLEFHPASEESHMFCASDDMMSEAYSDFQHLYALYKWNLDTGEMVMRIPDCGRIISCAAHMKMYEFMKEHRNRYLKRH